MSGAVTGTAAAAIVLLLGIVGIFGAVGFLYREQINDILTQFSDFLKGYGSAGYVLFVLDYELVFKIPVFCDHLTVVLLGACNTSCSSDNVNGLTVWHSIWHHAGLHISWLGMLPGTWAYVSAGATGRAFIKQASEAIFPGGPEQYWTVGIGLVATVVAASYVSRLAKDAIKEIEHFQSHNDRCS